ncbi:hypothetical protein [Pontibacter anaerobius]|uniref:Uncharacterized protein n=1 Tax=Pontibacter anaerobius TaxID=2993940 RepID=A0ABT3RKL5_9BACT|nr:hypothetical protein [Pontibacter anaerobius]MCX2742152.1 hypothetical protein [Pontibacter anaerobius]
MKRQVEIRWTVFLLAILIISFGLLTGFSFRETLDIQMHDTYFVIENFHLLILLIFTLAIVYLLTFGLKILAKTNRILKICSITITGLIGLSLIGLLALTIVLMIMTPISGQDLTSFGMIILIFGLAMLFSIRTREIWKLK